MAAYDKDYCYVRMSCDCKLLVTHPMQQQKGADRKNHSSCGMERYVCEEDGNFKSLSFWIY
ncbi:hypothetical protein HKD37_06G015387 [Glycine soja]